MKTQHLIWLLIGMGLLESMSSCRLNPPTQEGYTPAESADIEQSRAVDSCLNMARAYTEAADLIDAPTSATDIIDYKARKMFSDIQIKYLDSAAHYRKEAERLSTGD